MSRISLRLLPYFSGSLLRKNTFKSQGTTSKGTIILSNDRKKVYLSVAHRFAGVADF